jgi:hypothetical protein
LRELGSPLAFQSNADFSPMTGTPNGLFISKVIHQAFVEVNEEGTEAAAATAVSMSRSRSSEVPIEFNCNRPFIFIIHENVHNSILFLGKLVKTTHDPSLNFKKGMASISHRSRHSNSSRKDDSYKKTKRPRSRSNSLDKHKHTDP